MASLKHHFKNMRVQSGVHGVAGVLLDTGIGAGTSYGLGQLYHRKSDKWYGKHCARIAAIAGKVGALAAGAMLGPHIVTSGANAVGQAGVNAMALELGLQHARKATGKKAVLVPANAALPAGASELSLMGALGRAPAGKGLDWAQIDELAQGR